MAFVSFGSTQWLADCGLEARVHDPWCTWCDLVGAARFVPLEKTWIVLTLIPCSVVLSQLWTLWLSHEPGASPGADGWLLTVFLHELLSKPAMAFVQMSGRNQVWELRRGGQLGT